MDRTLTSLVDFIMSVEPERVPADVLDKARDLLVDTLACAVGGRECAAAKAADRFPVATGDEAGTVIGQARPYLPEVAAFTNTAMARYLDYNDTYPAGHPSDMFGALLAVARSAHVTGRDFLVAVVTAYEVYARFAETVHIRRPQTLDQGYGTCIGAVAGLSHLFKLSRHETSNALAMAATNSISLRASRAGELSDYKGIATAVAARDAIFFLTLARAGVTGPSGPFDGRHGIVELINGEAATMDIDDFNEWKIFNTRVKYWPVAYNIQPSIWAALELREKVDWRHLGSVTLYTSKFLKHESGSEPEKWDPKTRETADHSLPYIFARALQHGTIDDSTFELDAVLDPEVRELMAKVSVVVDTTVEDQWPRRIGLRVVADDVDGATYEFDSFDPRGHEANPLSKEDIQHKFVKLVEPFLGRERTQPAFDLAWKVEDLESIGPVLDAMAGRLHAME